MAHKRSSRKPKQQLDCPYCSKQLWRTGQQKHYLYYQGVSEIQQNLGISHKKAMLLNAQNNTYVDKNCWLEKFICEKHGQIWMRLSKDNDAKLLASLPNENDWFRTTGTINPDLPNPSVSEFTYRMSRRTQLPNLKDKSYNI